MSRRFPCLVLGHRWVFSAEGSTLRWGCARGCPVGGTREYATADEATKRLAVVNRGAPRPPLGLLAALGGTVHREPKRRAGGEQEGDR